MSIHIAEYQSEKLIIACRLIIASFLYWTGELDVASAAGYGDWLSLLSLSYLGYSVFLLILSLYPNFYFRFFRLITHLIDLTVFSLFVWWSDIPYQLVAILFSLLIASAAVRRHWLGVLLTGVAAVLIHSAVAASRYLGSDQPPAALIDPGLVAIYLVVLSLLLIYMAQHESRTRNELVKLATWPHDFEHEDLPSTLAKAVSELFDAPRTLLIWDEYEEPWRYIAYNNKGRAEQMREPPSTFEPLVASALSKYHFAKAGGKYARRVLLLDENDRLTFWKGAALNTELQDYYQIENVLALRLHSKTMQGWLFVLDMETLNSDDLITGKIVARQIETDLERWFTQRQTHLSIVTEERIKLASDLHDGLLQSLTGIALKIKAVEDQIEYNPEEIQSLLKNVRTSIQQEQRDLRTVVKSMRLAETELNDTGSTISKRLRELADAVNRDWSMNVDLQLPPEIDTLSDVTGHQIYRIAQEAMHNAARHSGGTALTIAVRVRGDRLEMDIRDDGRGFPFLGRYDLNQLKTMKFRPTSLIKRISNLQGNLVIDSSIEGSRLEISFSISD